MLNDLRSHGKACWIKNDKPMIERLLNSGAFTWRSARRLQLVVLALSVAVFASSASASVIGNFDFNNSGYTGTTCTGAAGGGVSVSATSIDWLPPGAGFGCISTGTSGTLSFSGSGAFNTTSQVGQILDLGAVPAANFITFSAFPQLTFNLASIGPGVANTTCAGLAVGQSCSVFAGSPIILTATATGTSVSLSANGTASDGVGAANPWIGVFTAQFVGLNPGQLQSTVCPSGSFPCLGGSALTNTYSANISVANVPEPGTMALNAAGAMLVAFGLLRRRKAVRK
jgi:hypothetical protein